MKKTLAKKYVADTSVKAAGKDVFYRPAGGVQTFMQVKEDIAVMVPWGENGADIPLTIDAGGYLNVTNPDDIYGIAETEFNETYRIIE